METGKFYYYPITEKSISKKINTKKWFLLLSYKN